MSLIPFLRDLFESGRVRVPADLNDAADDSADMDAALIAAEQAQRLELAGDPPLPILPAMRWAAVAFYKACQFLVHRDFDASNVNAALSVAAPTGDSPAQHYSVDVVFRFLPDLYALSRAVSQDDPLVRHLQRWGREWPLSSVGMAGLPPASSLPPSASLPPASGLQPPAFFCDPTLRQLYVDRIIARNDTSRLADPRVRQAIVAAVGLYRQLAPEIIEAVERLEAEESAT